MVARQVAKHRATSGKSGVKRIHFQAFRLRGHAVRDYVVQISSEVYAAGRTEIIHFPRSNIWRPVFLQVIIRHASEEPNISS